jgi:hypothetical protein
LIGIDRADSFLGSLAFFDEQDLLVGMLTQIMGRKQTGRPAAYDNDIVISMLL